jgi:ferric-dicitrate binding protein FerR (iron transport regulator)
MRNTIEGLNGFIKDPAREALAQPARRRIRGITACALFTALLLMAANLRKIRAWRTRATQHPAPAPTPRRRTSLHDHHPEG